MLRRLLSECMTFMCSVFILRYLCSGRPPLNPEVPKSYALFLLFSLNLFNSAGNSGHPYRSPTVVR